MKKTLTAAAIFLVLAGPVMAQSPRDAVNQADRARRQAENTKWDMERVGRSSDPFDKAGAVFDVLGDIGRLGK